MSRRPSLALVLVVLSGCASTPSPPDASQLDPIAHRYVGLVLRLGHHDANYVDAYYGPDSLKQDAALDSMPLTQIRAVADSLIARLGDSVPPYADTLVAFRHRYLRTQLGALSSYAGILGGQRLTFDAEAKALYDVAPPIYTDAHFDSLLSRLDALLPGPEPLPVRYERFRTQAMIPAAKVDTVFKVAIAACRARTLARLDLPAAERFELEYVKGTSWNAYNWYKGDSRSVIQVNLDFPMPIDRAVDLACHEGYPGHHVYNASLEQSLVRGRGWVELSIYPLFSPQSLIAEGSANYGIDMAFPGEERTAFERDSLFPLAGLDPAMASQNAEVRQVMDALNYARNEVARRYLNGAVDSTGAVALIARWWMQSPEASAKTLRFIQTYRSYVINYNLGRDLVADWVGRHGGTDEATRWRAFGALLASPSLPADLMR